MSDIKDYREVIEGIESGRAWQVNRSDDANDPRWVTPVDQSLDGLRRCGLVNVRLAPLPDEITIPARVIPAPLREAPKDGTVVYVAYPGMTDFYSEETWKHGVWIELQLERGLVFAKKEHAEQAGKAMCPYA